jgi:dihydrofolate reductase
MRKLKYHVASTLDGFIAHEDHTVDGFVAEGEHATDYLASLKSDYDIVLMGRRTYEFGFQYGVTNPYPWLKQYVFSGSMKSSPDTNVELISGDVVEFTRNLKQQTGKAIYLCGGANLAGTLLAAKLVDEIIIKLNPVVFGTGLPLFSGSIKQTALQLLESKTYDNSVVLLRYQIVDEQTG